MSEVEEKLDELENDEAQREKIAQELIDLEQVIPGVSPGAVLDAMDDPDAFAAIARGDLYVQLARLRQRMSHPGVSTTQMMEYSKFLAKMGQVESADKGGGSMLDGVPMISIVLPGSGGEVRIGAPAKDEKDVTPKPASAVLPS